MEGFGFPSRTGPILANEAAETFRFYSMKNIFNVFMFNHFFVS